jgi:polysaccharide biosynthesis protein PslH
MADLLWLSSETPDVYGGGGQRRQYHQISALVEHGIEVVVATLAGPQSDSSIQRLAPVHRFEGRRRHRRNRRLEHLIETAAPARALVAHVESAPQVFPELRRAGVPFLVDFQNVVSRWHAAGGERRLAAAWRNRERDALLAAARATACSVEERDALVALGTDTPVDVAPHGIDRDEWPTTALHVDREAALAMFGSWNHEPNRIAAEWLIYEVWPHVRHMAQDSHLLLFGPGQPPASVLGVDGVEARGRVASLAATLGRVRVAVVPIRRGIGARVKFVESLASGAAVVSTTAGCEGFAADGAFVRADEPQVFADACVKLLCDEAWARTLGRRGRELVLSRYTWAQVSEPILVFARGE